MGGRLKPDQNLTQKGRNQPMIDKFINDRDSQDQRDRETLHNLADLLPVLMEKESGDVWHVSPEPMRDDWHPHLTGRARVSAFTLTRARDGFEIEIRPSGAWNEKDKANARILWPDNPNESGAYSRMTYRAAPGVAHDAPEPGISFTISKAKPETLARRLLKELTGPEYDAARAGLVDRINAQSAAADQAAQWREKVAAAAGLGLHYSTGTGKTHLHNRGAPKPFDIDTAGEKWPGGKLTLDLPKDPEQAADLVGKIRALVEAANGESV